MIAAPLSNALMNHFASASSIGVAETFVVLGVVYAAFMASGALLFRVPEPGWRPPGWTPATAKTLVTTHNVDPATATRTRPFWLLWAVLCLNVTAGIGVLGQASAMIQEVFQGRITTGAAAGFVGLLSLFNMGGRFFWSSLSDRIGRKPTYAVFFGLGFLLYAAVPVAGRLGSVTLFVACFAAILTMYGGGFATIPAYLSDLFGTRFVGAIHGRLLTAWSTAGVLGPVLVNYIREYEIGRGVPKTDAYNFTMFLMAGLLVIGMVCNLLVRAVDAKYYLAENPPVRPPSPAPALAGPNARFTIRPALLAAWLVVGIPLAWGVAATLGKAAQLFR
jgi:MFS family permease